MANGIDKKALFKLKSEPYLKPISDLGVGFYNLDENTAILRFQLSNTKGPLLIHESNLTAYAYFESSNGSASDVIELEIEDSNNGIVSITLNKDFLQASTSTKVKGQVYIAVNNHDGDPAYNEVAVFREFNFEVADALINKISSFTKVENIRMFNQLKIHIEQRVNDIDAAIANGEDYVAQMNATLLNGKTQLNQIVTDGTATIDGTVTQAISDITATIDSATSEITTLSNNTKTDVQNTADNAITEITNTSNTATTHVDTKVAEFNQAVLDNGFITPEQLTTDLDALDWQKYKLTNDNGNAKTLNSFDFNNLDSLTSGYYFLNVSTNHPFTGTSYGFLTVMSAGTTRKVIAMPFNSNAIYVRTKNTSADWSDWEEINSKESDTGWVPFTIINGGRSNTVYPTRGGYKCSYRTITKGSVTERRVRVNADNIDHDQVIAQLPPGFVKELQVGYIRSTGGHNATNLLIETTGEVKVYIANRTEWEVSDSNFIYGEISWVE